MTSEEVEKRSREICLAIWGPSKSEKDLHEPMVILKAALSSALKAQRKSHSDLSRHCMSTETTDDPERGMRIGIHNATCSEIADKIDQAQ